MNTHTVYHIVQDWYASTLVYTVARDPVQLYSAIEETLVGEVVNDHTSFKYMCIETLAAKNN